LREEQGDYENENCDICCATNARTAKQQGFAPHPTNFLKKVRQKLYKKIALCAIFNFCPAFEGRSELRPISGLRRQSKIYSKVLDIKILFDYIEVKRKGDTP